MRILRLCISRYSVRAPLWMFLSATTYAQSSTRCTTTPDGAGGSYTNCTTTTQPTDGSFIRQEPAVAMMASVYATLGAFLLLAIRNPSAHRSLIAFTAWSSFAHAAIMAVQASRNMIQRGELVGVAVLAVIGVVLIALAPAQESVQRTSTAAVAHS